MEWMGRDPNRSRLAVWCCHRDPAVGRRASDAASRATRLRHRAGSGEGRPDSTLLSSPTVVKLICIVSRQERCWYPQSWADDVIANGTSSEYHAVVGDLIDDEYDWFSDDVPEIGGASCIQHAYNYFASCTDEDRIAVRAIDVLWDVRNATIGSFGDIGLHEFPDRYCVEVVDIDRWRQIVHARDFLPKPVRATYPQYRTLVGLENQVWYEVEEGQDRYVDGFYVELPTPGTTYNINVTIWLEELAIDIDGDGDWDHTVTCSTGDAESVADCGGSLEDPIFTFEYEQRAYHHFVIESRWAGEAIDEEGIIHILDPELPRRAACLRLGNSRSPQFPRRIGPSAHHDLRACRVGIVGGCRIRGGTMRPMRTWRGPAYRGEGLVGNAIKRRFTDAAGQTVTELQDSEAIIPGGVVELRVHGVNGGSPEQNLHDPNPVLVSGDETAGFYRRRQELLSGPDRTVEAYNWSSINSKKRVRAWWLVLFPFAAANFAGWLLPKGQKPAYRTASQVLVRLIGLCVTILAVIGAALLFVDLIGVQSSAVPSCTVGVTWGWVGAIADWGIIDNRPVRLAVAYSFLPAFALLALWLLGRRSGAYEAYGAGDPQTDEPIGDIIDGLRMDHVEFWQAPDVVYVQAWLHATAALAALAAVMAFALREIAPGAQHDGTLYSLGVMSLVVVAVAAVAVTGVSRMRQIPRRWLRKTSLSFFRPRWSWLPAGAAIILFCAVSWLGWVSVGGANTDQAPLEAIRNGLISATVAAVAMVFVLALLVGAWRSAGFAFVVGPALFYFMAQVGDSPNFTWLSGGAWLTIELVLAMVGVAWYSWRAGQQPQPPDPKEHAANPVWIVGTTGVIIVAGAAAIIRIDSVVLQIAAVLIPLVYLGLQFATQIRYGHDYPAKEEMREGTAAVIAALGVTSILTAISSGAVFVAGRLGESRALPRLVAGGSSDFCLSTIICYPAEVGWYSLAALAGFLALGVIVVLRLAQLNLLRWRAKRPDLCVCYDGDDVPTSAYDIEGACTADEHHPDRLGFAKRGVTNRWFANITDDADWMISAAVMTTLTLLVAATVARLENTLPTATTNTIFDWAAWFVGFVVVGAALLVYTARDNKQMRETMGILWDVMSFFPRRFHPLAPPCYAERSVIDVRNRVIYMTTRGTDMKSIPESKVILAAHSEGTLITTAALLSLLPGRDSRNPDVADLAGHPQPTGDELDRVAFVTYGCMLARLFGRAWPDQLSEDVLVELKERLEGPTPRPGAVGPFPNHPVGKLTKWMNFGRYSDYLGGRVFAELQRKPTDANRSPEGDHRCDDVFFSDPIRRWRWHGQLEHARLWRHTFDYESDAEDPRMREHIWAMARVFDGEDEADVLADYPWMTACETDHQAME